jgi:anaerobic selenocysteine-containing dehydrogenase/subtilisin family serine protease
MQLAKIDPSLSMLLPMTLAEVERIAAEGRIAIAIRGETIELKVLITCSGDLPAIEGVEVIHQVGNIVTVNLLLSALDRLSEHPEVVYIEAVRSGRPLLNRSRALVGAAIVDGQNIRAGAEAWDGTGTTVGVIDSGFDLRHPAFRLFPGGPTRVEWYWDRWLTPRPGTGDVAGPGNVGVVYQRNQIDTHLLGAAANPPVLHPDAIDIIGHGSHVAGIAAGRGTDFRGVASGARLILVRLLDADISVLHDLCDWIFARAGGPCAINISQGNTSGPHDGTSGVETGLDTLLRDPATLAPRPGRFVAVAAGNDRIANWHVRTTVLPTGRPVTQLVWVSPANNTAADEVVFWYAGLDQLRVRLRSPLPATPANPNRLTHWVAPDPAGCIEQASPDPGSFAPVAAGAAVSKTFNFTDGTRAILSHAENALNGDRQITVRIEPAAAGAAIAEGFWLLEFEGVNALPAGGQIQGFLRMDAVNTAPANTRLLRPAFTVRNLTVIPGQITHQEVFLPFDVQRTITVFLEYPESQDLQVQVRPVLFSNRPPTQWVGHNRAAIADATLTAPAGAAGAAGLPFDFAGMIVNVNHVTVAGRKRITVEITGTPPDGGLYRINLRTPPGVSIERAIAVQARLVQDHTAEREFCILYDEPVPEAEVEVFPAACGEAVSRLAIGVHGPFETRQQIRVPGGGLADVRVRIPPTERSQETGGWSVTPWISPGNNETATPGSLPVVGGAAAARVYNQGTTRITVDYPIPAAGTDGLIALTLEDTGATLHEGQWKLEYRGRGINAPLKVYTQLNRSVDNQSYDTDLGFQLIPDFEFQLVPDLDRQQIYLQEVERGAHSIPFIMVRETADEIRLEVIYPAGNDLRLRLRPPAPDHLPFAVGVGNALVTDAGAVAPVVTPVGVSATLRNGAIALIHHPQAEVFPGYRRALVTLRSPAGTTVFHPLGLWRLEIEPVRLDRDATVTARLTADGHAAQFILAAPPNPDAEQGTLRVPATTREVLTVANGIPTRAPLLQPNVDSSPGPVRSATMMRVGGNPRRWLPYAKPEIIAPGTGIVAPCSAFTEIWRNAELPAGWNFFQLADGRVLGMRASWPLVENGRLHTINVAPAAAAGTVTETTWNIVIPDGAAGVARLVIRYPANRNFAIRMEQPAGAAAHSRTSAVDRNGAEVAITGATTGQATSPHPDGAGRVFSMGDSVQVLIRQNGQGQAIVTLRHRFAITAGTWRLIVRHTEVFPAPVAVTVEAEPELHAAGWPKFNPELGLNSPRVEGTLGVAPGAANPATVNIPITMPAVLAADVRVRVRYPAPPAVGGYLFHVLVLNPGATQRTRAIDGNGAIQNFAGALPIDPTAPAIANGARFRFGTNANPGNHVTIVHTPGEAIVTFSRGPAASHQIATGSWVIVVANLSTTTPAAPVNVTVEIDPGPHDAPFFRLPTGLVPYAFMRSGYLAAGVIQEWVFRVPQGRRTPLTLEVIYDAQDTLQLQVQSPTGDRTQPVGFNNAAIAGAADVTLNATARTPNEVRFVAANRFQLVIDHRVHPQTSGARNRVRITLQPDGNLPLPDGNWLLRLNPTAIGAGSFGVVEAWIEEMLYFSQSGTSMAAPHIAGLAALILQQDHTTTHTEIKQRLLSTARPAAVTRQGDLQLPNQWDATAGWGVVDGAAALLGHTGGFRHNRGSAPATLGKTTGCPIACEDNCLLEGVRTGANLTDLRPARQAPYNRSPDKQGGDPLPDCPRLQGYLERYHSATPFTGGEQASFQTLTSVRLSQPLIRDREQRNGLNQFRAVAWDEVYTTLAERLVEQWSSTGAVVVLEGRSDAGLVREILFNRFVHHLHRLLAANNQVSKCSFSTKRKVTVLSSRVPFGGTAASGVYKGLQEFFKGNPPGLHGRADLSLSQTIVVWGANLPANAQALWRTIAALHDARGTVLKVFVIDPGLQELPGFVHRITLAPGSDRHLALALLLRLVGNPAHAQANRQIPPNPRFADAARGLKQFLDPLGAHLDDFITHVRTAAATYLQVNAGAIDLDADLTNQCIPHATAAERSRFLGDFQALLDAYLSGATATLLGTGASRYVDGEEQIQYIAALAFLTGNLGVAGGGISFGEDRQLAWNSHQPATIAHPNPFAAAHDSRRPQSNPELGTVEEQEELNLAALAADAPDNTKVLLWFDQDPLTHLPDALAVQGLLERTQLNIQVTSALDDSSRYADIILPLGDTLISWDLQMGQRSPWINLTQPLKTPDETGARPLARILHELFKAVRDKLLDRFHRDLKPTIDESLYQVGPLLLSRSRRQDLSAFFTDVNRIPNLLKDRLPTDEVANIHSQLRNWYASVHSGEPTTDTETQVTATNAVKFFDRMQVDWMLECLFANYTEREAVMLLYNLLQRGTVLDPNRFKERTLGILPDGGTPFGDSVLKAEAMVDLKGTTGFAPERPVYGNAVRAIDTGSSGRSRYPMRLIIAQAKTFASTHIPLNLQVSGGRIQVPTAVVNPHSPSLSGRILNNGDRVALVGNVTYAAGQTFETVIAQVQVQLDESVAPETIWMQPGWQGLDRGGQRLIRGIHLEEGEAPALFDNLVRIEIAGYTPASNAANRGSDPAKR